MASDDLIAAIAKLSAADREKLRTRAKAPVPEVVTPPKPALDGGTPKIGSDVGARWAARGHDRYGRAVDANGRLLPPDLPAYAEDDEDPLKGWDR
jgi:hypothetical protein